MARIAPHNPNTLLLWVSSASARTSAFSYQKTKSVQLYCDVYLRLVCCDLLLESHPVYTVNNDFRLWLVAWTECETKFLVLDKSSGLHHFGSFWSFGFVFIDDYCWQSSYRIVWTQFDRFANKSGVIAVYRVQGSFNQKLNPVIIVLLNCWWQGGSIFFSFTAVVQH